MKTLSIDIETYSDQPLAKTGVYRYVESPVFEILLFSYSADGGPVQLVDLACGEKIPTDILAALEDDSVTKWAFNASFERICLSRYLGYPTGEYLTPNLLELIIVHVIHGIKNTLLRTLGNAPWSGLPQWDCRFPWKASVPCWVWKSKS